MRKNSLKKIRESLLMSKAELARKANISHVTIARIENGFPCRLETKRRILLALGLKISDQRKVFAEDAESGHIQILQMETKPDLIILDLMMPRRSGLLVLEGMREMDQYIPAIMITGCSSRFPITSCTTIDSLSLLNESSDLSSAYATSSIDSANRSRSSATPARPISRTGDASACARR